MIEGLTFLFEKSPTKIGCYPQKQKSCHNVCFRTIQDLLEHSDAQTTMIYTHTIRSQIIKTGKGPLEFCFVL